MSHFLRFLLPLLELLKNALAVVIFTCVCVCGVVCRLYILRPATTISLLFLYFACDLRSCFAALLLLLQICFYCCRKYNERSHDLQVPATPTTRPALPRHLTTRWLHLAVPTRGANRSLSATSCLRYVLVNGFSIQRLIESILCTAVHTAVCVCVGVCVSVVCVC